MRYYINHNLMHSKSECVKLQKNMHTYTHTQRTSTNLHKYNISIVWHTTSDIAVLSMKLAMLIRKIVRRANAEHIKLICDCDLHELSA